MDLNIRLTLAQKFELRKYQDQLPTLTVDEKDKIIIELARQVFVKDNLIKDALKDKMDKEAFSIEAFLAERNQEQD